MSTAKKKQPKHFLREIFRQGNKKVPGPWKAEHDPAGSRTSTADPLRGVTDEARHLFERAISMPKTIAHPAWAPALIAWMSAIEARLARIEDQLKDHPRR